MQRCERSDGPAYPGGQRHTIRKLECDDRVGPCHWLWGAGFPEAVGAGACVIM